MKTEGIGVSVVYNIRFINDKLVLREWEFGKEKKIWCEKFSFYFIGFAWGFDF